VRVKLHRTEKVETIPTLKYRNVQTRGQTFDKFILNIKLAIGLAHLM